MTAAISTRWPIPQAEHWSARCWSAQPSGVRWHLHESVPAISQHHMERLLAPMLEDNPGFPVCNGAAGLRRTYAAH
ncbi:hypothetical protein KCP76_06155 [Salmonella enterica subsp. enterica serovar Weltevreden]|nr:hypothetical protein KCP76_06155 [Salmonella enterica subsp. enterica serovar Weltevreden]